MIVELELCKQQEGRRKLLPAAKVGNAESQYKHHLKCILHFCKLIGDVRSMIILSKTVKARTRPSVNPHAIAKYAGYKIGRKGTVLHDTEDNIVHYVNNNPIKCVEDWTSQECYEKFLASMSNLHKNHNREGLF